MVAFTAVFYSFVIGLVFSTSSTRDDAPAAILFCLLNPFSWIVYYFILLIYRDASWALYIRYHTLGWMRPKLLGGNAIEEVDLFDVSRIVMIDGDESRSLTIIKNDGKRIPIASSYLGEMDLLERVIRLHFHNIELEVI